MFAILNQYFSPVVNQDEQLGFLKIIKPLYVVLVALGLFPRAVEFPDGKTNTIVVSKHTIINAACTVLMILVTHGSFVLYFFELNVPSKVTELSEKGLTLTTYIVQLVMQGVFCTFSYFCFIRDNSFYIAMLNNIAECWDRLPKGKKGRILGQLRVQVNCMVLGCLFLMFFYLLILSYTRPVGIWKNILLFTTFAVTEMLQFTFIAFLVVKMLMLVALLKNIEEEFTLIIRKRQNVRDNFDNADLGGVLAEIGDVYVKAMGIKRQMNAAYQAQILAMLAITFYKLVILPHRVYHWLAFQMVYTANDVIECTCVLFHQLMKVYVLSQSGCLLKPQINRIGRTLHDIPRSGSQDLEVYLEVQYFSSLMASQDATITIYGYFPLDATLMFGMVASAAMYLIIVVQFDK